MKKEIIALSVIFLIIILGSFIFSQAGKRSAQTELVPNRSTYNSAPTGCKAFYLLLQKLGFETSRWQLPFKKLDSSLSPKSLLVMINPLAVGGGGEAETEILLSWVRKGGSLFIIDDANNGVIKSLDLKIERTQELWEAEEQILPPLLPTAYMKKVRRIKVRGDAHLTSPTPPQAIVHLQQDENGPVLLSQNLGKGQLTILTSPYVASNQGIAKEDNVILLTNIIAKEGAGRKILFDEYHHGYDSSLSLTGYYRNTPVAGVTLQILLVSIMLFATLSRRFGKPRSLEKEESRSILEYVKSLASLYYKAELQSSVIRNIYLRYKNLWIKKFGLSPNMEPGELCSFISARANLPPKKFSETISKCEKVSGKAIKLNPGEFLNLVRDLEIYRRKIDGQS